MSQRFADASAAGSNGVQSAARSWSSQIYIGYKAIMMKPTSNKDTRYTRGINIATSMIYWYNDITIICRYIDIDIYI